ncbi:uncharacterized protein LOC102710169 [Oryza brachyantha]|uniref:DUF1618 domain-containing protein n=1 Tax=Oryza brachyantha TaxID=4533 RepID=J3NBM8_ORYBR|nr:uncharacterized protein LOC102710169 [Oryza brachyantha]
MAKKKSSHPMANKEGDPAPAAEEEQAPRPRAPHCPWVILPSISRVNVNLLPPSDDFRFKLELPPRTSAFSIAGRLIQSGQDMVSFTVPRARTIVSLAPPHASAPHIIAVHSRLILISTVSGILFVCDSNTRAATRLPPFLATESRQEPRGDATSSIGVIQDSRSGHSMVAYLLRAKPTTGRKSMELICWSSASASSGWMAKPLTTCPHPLAWGGQGGVITHNDKLYFIDLALGVLCCDPSAEKPGMGYIPLPETCQITRVNARSSHNIEKCRGIKLTEGKLCFIQIASDVLSLWTAVESQDPRWICKFKINLYDIWVDKTYKASGLRPGKVPAIALVDPMRCGVVYLMQEDVLFAVDLRSMRTCLSDKFQPCNGVLHARWHAWVVPSPLQDCFCGRNDGPEQESLLSDDGSSDDEGDSRSWIYAQGTVSAGQAAVEFMESQLEAIQGFKRPEQEPAQDYEAIQGAEGEVQLEHQTDGEAELWLWVHAQGTISAGEAAVEFFESQLGAIQGAREAPK